MARGYYAVPEWPYAWGGPIGSGTIKTIPDDFIVWESLPFAPEGKGEHVFLLVEKVGENTEYVARVLARYAGIRQRDVGFAGLKDRHARTRQWFSLWLPGRHEPDWSGIEQQNFKVLQAVRHARKLKRGVLAGNDFHIRIRNWQGDRVTATARLERIAKEGVPNYFAEQRFGRDGQNVNKALALANNKKCRRESKGIYLSAVRAFLFNCILMERVRRQDWNRLLPGDICQFHENRSLFRLEDPEEADVQRRLQKGAIHPTGLLWGEEDLKAVGEAGEIERKVVEQFPELTSLLRAFDLKTDRRPLRMMPERLRWRFTGDGELELAFGLTAGSYATALLREMVVDQPLLGGEPTA